MEYARAGVTEYWIVDPDAKTVETMRLDAGAGTYGAPRVLAVGEDLTSRMFPGFSLALAAFFAEA